MDREEAWQAIVHMVEKSQTRLSTHTSKLFSSVRSLSRVQLFATPWTVPCQASLSMEFSSQECWSGLPFGSPGDLPILGIKPRSPALQVNSLPSEPPEKPKNTGVGSLSIFQGVCPTQESNWGLPHCRQILYQLSYQRSQRVSYLGLNSKRD